MRPRIHALIDFLLAGLLLFGIRGDARGEPGSSEPGMGTIRGTVSYQADAARPWRLSRYYVRKPGTGELAEAVVALSRRGLKGADADREAQTVTVDQKDFQFTPESVAIRVGDRVRFLNSDHQVHNVRMTSARHSFDVNMPPEGEHIETFRRATSVRQPHFVGCSFHTAMRTWIYVFDHPWFQLTGHDGAFELRDVPPGEYRIEVNHAAGELRASQTIVARADETVDVDLRLSPDDRRRPGK
ncbi:MAG: hypothetical protein FJ297_02275 [Planctomycetes bacterium]|nr:hypothetical protein [Planctomycetota bacterium]